MVAQCPICQGTLNVSELNCPRCEIQLSGTFDLCRFCRLTPETLSFVETFLRCEGNLSRMEKEIGLSYPTLRNRLHAALEALGLRGEPEPPAPPLSSADQGARHRDILGQLESGTIDAATAARLLAQH